MKKVLSTFSNEIEINKSRFIAFLIPITDTTNISDIISSFRLRFRDATHVCYALVCNTSSRSSDDGEPKGTAGRPILEVLMKNNIIDTLCIVIRYFGGIKLGAGGVLRAYTQAAAKVIEVARFSYERMVINYTLDVPYESQSLIESKSNILMNLNRSYNAEDVSLIYSFSIDKDNEKDIESILSKSNKIKLISKEEKVDFV